MSDTPTPSRERMPETIEITKAHKGRYMIGPSRFPGTPIVVQITGRTRQGKPTGRCVWGVFADREVRLDNPWHLSAWIEEGDAGWLNDEETACGTVRGGEWVVLHGDEAKAAYAKACA